VHLSVLIWYGDISAGIDQDKFETSTGRLWNVSDKRKANFQEKIPSQVRFVQYKYPIGSPRIEVGFPRLEAGELILPKIFKTPVCMSLLLTV
jgi:hypothetical protein